MAEPHDFKRFPELTNKQMETLRFESPHKQIVDIDNFVCEVVKVHDGDTIRVKWPERDFDFPIRFLDTNAPELNEEGGKKSKEWLKERIEHQTVMIIINKKNRVDKWGRLLGRVIHRGGDVGEDSIALGFSTSFDKKDEGKIPNLNKELNIKI